MNTKKKWDIKLMLKTFFTNAPLSLAGVSLGTMGVATFLVSIIEKFTQNKTLNTQQGVLFLNLAIIIFCIIIASIYCFILITKYFCAPKLLLQDIKNHKTSGAVAIIFLSLCIILNAISWIINHFVLNYELRWKLLIFPSILLVFIVVLQVIFTINFLFTIIFKKQTLYNEAYGSWFVALVGLTISSCYTNNFGDIIPLLFFQFIWIMGFIFFIFLFPWVLYKFLYLGHKDKQDIPSMAIAASPANLLVVGFFTSFDPKRAIIHNTNMPLHWQDTLNLTTTFLNNEAVFKVISIFLIISSAFSYILYFIVVIKAISLFNYLQFWTAFTFPGTATATAIYKITMHFYEKDFIILNVLFILMFFIFTFASFSTILVNVKHINILKNNFRKIKQGK